VSDTMEMGESASMRKFEEKPPASLAANFVLGESVGRLNA